jgi:predicted nucleic acid-binding Zn ribbon protein
MNSRNKNNHTIRDLIRVMLNDAGLQQKFDRLEIIRCYHEAMGTVISNKTKEVIVKDRTLILKINSGALKEELSMNKQRIIELVNERFGSKAIDDLEIW